MRDSNKKFIIISILLVLIIGVIFICNKDKEKVQLDEVKLKEANTNKGMFAIMLEKTDDSNEYEESKNNIFPSTGYLYNEEKSGCIDGNNKAVEDVLTYNEETKKVSVKTKQTVYCYLYFKKDSKVPDVTNFYVGTQHGSEYTNQENQTVHIEWNDEDVEEYCIKEETENNDSSNCVWKSIEELSPVDLEASHKVETTIDLGTENKKYDYDVFLKDRAGNESTVDEISEDEIILDTQAPTISNISQVGEAKETSIEVSVTVNDPSGTDGTAGSGIEHIYYQIKEKNSGTIKETYHDNGTVTSYTFDDNLTAGTEYTVEVYAADLAGNSSVTTPISSNFMTKKMIKEGLAKICENKNLKNCMQDLKNRYSEIESLNNNKKGDLTYRYVGNQSQSSSINNYVCFGDESCSTGAIDNHMYRIIGITDGGNLKIQKNSSITPARWYTVYQLDIKWPQSTMYTSTLSSFYNDGTYVSQSMKDKIEENHTWNTGDVNGDSSSQIGTGDTVYNLEKVTQTHTGEIGLAYLSDYYFAYNEDGTQNCYNYSYCKSWMIPNDTDLSSLWSKRYNEWTMTYFGLKNSNYRAWALDKNGYSSWNNLNSSYAVRPVFYLNSDVTISEGNGTLSSPYIIN